MENEIAEALGGWQTFLALETPEADALRERWPEISGYELLELKLRYRQ
jgi:hypothetical protein